jgi:hypothetical protein
MNSRRKFLQTASAALGGFVLATPADASAKQQMVTILHGSGAPGKRKGVVGDFYIDDRSHSIYGPKPANGWGRPTSLIGPAGPAGPAGASGSPNPSGLSLRQPYLILNGTGPPLASTGVDNDFYVDTSTTQLYGPREDGMWGSPISLTGRANITIIDGGTL